MASDREYLIVDDYLYKNMKMVLPFIWFFR